MRASINESRQDAVASMQGQSSSSREINETEDSDSTEISTEEVISSS